MSTLSRVGLALALLAGFVSLGSYAVTAQVNGNDNKIDIMDDCLPSDTTFPGGGCVLKPHQGDVSNVEFGQLLSSALQIQTATGLVPALIGHPSWRNEPSHITTPQGKLIKISNRGGRTHTFTEVDHFGGGRVPPLNVGLQTAPECNPALTVDLPPGASTTIAVAEAGLHKFQCCIHPWMRATIRVE